ncbi:MAG TPA: VIT and VWA domain-containing protein [Pyrinomonadaceae bacterium]|nr:VIT and VWA domain-containing protein [Pyrinomonadaceae bacterium]
MKIRLVASICCVVFVGLLSAMPAAAQGIIVPIVCLTRPCRPVPPPRPLPNVLPVKSINLDTKIVGQVATTHVEQVFRNDTPYTLEGTYFFPIPETASIVEFAIWENGKKLSGEVRSREEARRIYDEIVRRQRDPGLLEYAGKDLFQASIFPIPPNSDKKLELTYSQVLKAESGTVAYRYPLGTGRNVFSGSIPYAEVMSARPGPQQKFGTISAHVEITAKNGLRNIYSPTHNIEVTRKGEVSASVSFETNNNDNDFQLFYGVSDDDFGVTLLTHREPGKDGYFLLMLSPRDRVAETDVVNKDIVFVLDTSGSMADEGKMDKARAAMLFGIRSLREGDRFNVINFAGEEHLMERGLIGADAEGKRRGEEFVKKLRPSGGTNINDSLIASLKQFEKNDRPKMLVFMTDGLPTVSETNIDKIIANIKTAKTADVRIFPFGVGYDVNTALLDKLGSENSGMSDYVQPNEDIEIKVSNFFTRVSSPVLSDLEIDFGGVETDLMYPRKLTDLFRGMQTAVVGRYRNESDLQNITLMLRGKSGRELRTYRYDDLDFPLRSDENDFLPRLWASRRVGWLIEQIRLNGETKELRDEVTELGTRYGIVTPYTSYLATDGTYNAPSPLDSRAIGGLQAGASRKMEEKSGAFAVRQSVQQNSMQMNTQIAKDKRDDILIRNSVTNQFVGSKNFFNQSNVWVDAEYKPDAKLPETNVKFGSEEYFALAKRERSLAQYLSLGEEVVVVWKNRVYRITK